MIPFSIQFTIFDWREFVMYKSMKTLIGRKFYKTAAIAQSKLDVFFAANRLVEEEYLELSALVADTYEA